MGVGWNLKFQHSKHMVGSTGNLPPSLVALQSHLIKLTKDNFIALFTGHLRALCFVPEIRMKNKYTYPIINRNTTLAKNVFVTHCYMAFFSNVLCFFMSFANGKVDMEEPCPDQIQVEMQK